MGALGLILMVGVAYLASSSRKSIRWRVVVSGIGLQFLFAFLLLEPHAGGIFAGIANYVTKLIRSSQAGSLFVFGNALGSAEGQWESVGAGGKNASYIARVGFIFAFQVLPSVIFVSALFAILYQLRIMPVVISLISRPMRRLLTISGAESTFIAANVFMDQTSAPLAIRPFLEKLTVSELFTIMVSGMARVSAPSMAAYIALGQVEMRHLLAAVILTGPGSVMFSKLLEPETATPVTLGDIDMTFTKPSATVIDATVQGASDGIHLCLMMTGVLIASVSLLAMLDVLLGDVHSIIPFVPQSTSTILGWLGAPFAWLIGVPWKDSSEVGNLLGTRLVLNEFLAFGRLGELQRMLEPRSVVLATYALCGFANLTSIAVQVGALGVLAPHRRADVARLGLKACLAATMANLTAACIVGLTI